MALLDVIIKRIGNIIVIDGTAASVTFHPRNKDKTYEAIITKCKEVESTYTKDFDELAYLKSSIESQLTQIYAEFENLKAAVSRPSKAKDGGESEDDKDDDLKVVNKIPARQILYDLAVNRIERIFKDQNNNLYVVCKIDGKKEVLDIDSELFYSFCRRLYEADYIRLESIANKLAEIQRQIEDAKESNKDYSDLLDEKLDLAEIYKAETKHDKVIQTPEFRNAKDQIRALWIKDTETKVIGKRVIWNKKDNVGYYFLGNKNGDIVKIEADVNGKSWSIANNSDLLLFSKLPLENEQCVPIQVEDLSQRLLARELLSDIHFKNDKHPLITEVYTLALFLDGIPHPMLLPNGPERTGKSTLMAKIKSIADPREMHNLMSYEEVAGSNLSKINFDPKKEWDRALEYESNWVTFGDNVSSVTGPVMDELCSLVQGGYRLSKKKNYTDKEQSTVSITRPLGFNSIINFMSRPDANVRTFAPELQSREDFFDTEELWQRFFTNKPSLLGYCFGIISKFLDLYPKVKNEIRPLAKDGLTSFEKAGEVLSRCLGNKPGEFQKAWLDYYSERLENSIQQSTLAQLVIIYVRQSGKESFSAQPTDVYNQLRSIGASNGFDLQNDHSFPTHQNTLTKALKRIENILKQEGILITIGEKENEQRVIKFKNLKAGEGPSVETKPFSKDDRIFKLIASELEKDGPIKHESLQRNLISSGKFFAGEAHQAIEDAIKAAVLEVVDFQTYHYKPDTKTSD